MENEPNNPRAETERSSTAAPLELQVPASVPPVENYPFWGYLDVAIFLVVTVFGWFAVNVVLWILRPHFVRPVFVLLPAQCLIYAFSFFTLYSILERHYKQPFWPALRWVTSRPSETWAILYGFALAFTVIFIGIALRTPDIQTPMKELLSDRTSMLLIAIFAVTLGPLCEELAFRGFLQPLLVHSFGAAAGILLTAVPFGLLHLPEYAWSWRHGVLISVAGIGFGCMRQISGSTRASTIMHAAYNFIPFVAMFSQKGSIPRAW